MKAEIVSDPHALQEIKADWDRLAAGFPSPLLSHEWCAACARWLLAEHDKLAVFVVHASGRVRAIAPMVAVRRAGLTRLQELGHQFWEPGGFLYSDEDALRALVDAMYLHRKPFVLNRMEVDSPEARALRGRKPTFSCLVERDAAPSASLPLDKDPEAFEARIPAKHRSKLRRFRKRAEEIGALEFDAVEPAPDELDAHLRDLYRVEASGWKGRNGTATLSSLPMLRFYDDYAKAASGLGQLRLFFLRANSETIAVRMAVCYANRLWELKIAYDENWKKCAPGVLLTRETLLHACRQRLDAYEFLGAAEQWQRLWNVETRRYASARAYMPSFGGALSFGHDAGKFAAKNILGLGASKGRPAPENPL